MHHGNSHGIKWGGRAEKEMALGARFQKLRGDLTIRRGLNSQRGLNSGGLPCFSATMSFLWQHCYKLFIPSYSRILDTNRLWSYLAIQPSNFVLVGRPVVNVALLSTFLAVQYL